MASWYAYGTNRLRYKATLFQTGLTVTAYFYDPDNEESGPYEFTELERGGYYLDFDFNKYGSWQCFVYEDGELKADGKFLVMRWPGIVTYRGT